MEPSRAVRSMRGSRFWRHRRACRCAGARLPGIPAPLICAHVGGQGLCKPGAAGREPRGGVLADHSNRQHAVTGKVSDGHAVDAPSREGRRLRDPHSAALMQCTVPMQESDQSCSFGRGQDGNWRGPVTKLRRRKRLTAGAFFVLVRICFQRGASRNGWRQCHGTRHKMSGKNAPSTEMRLIHIEHMHVKRRACWSSNSSSHKRENNGR